MVEREAPWLAGVREVLRAPLERCARGEAAPHLALMQVLVEAAEPAEAGDVLARAILMAERAGDAVAARRLQAMLDTSRAHPEAWASVRGVIAGIEHGPAPDPAGDPVAHWAATFDRAVAASPEGSVALYSLGSPDLLARATAEVVARLDAWQLLDGAGAALDIGCGIGRFEAALAPKLGSIVGLDISAGMLAAARRRCAGLGNVAFVQGSGRDLAPFKDHAFGLVFAVDSFPYLVLSGADLAAAQIREAARVLAPGGSLVIFNYSYRADLAADRRDLAAAAAAAGLRIIRDGTRDLAEWDGLAFHLVRER